MLRTSSGWVWLLLLWGLAPSLAYADSALPLGRTAGGLSTSTDLVQQLQHVEKTAKARTQGRQLEQVIVTPQRPGRNNVRYYGFDWRHYDYLADRGVGGIRFLYYQRELGIARIAANLVREQYDDLAEKFNYRPTSRVPYILYNSHREFENTNVFFVNEYILGVTSPLDLRMALPFWGEVERFREVSTHEMTHQFQIQKMSELAAAAGVESAINRFPLWFTEGLAEYYSKDGIDLETDMFARDILLNPRPDKGYALPNFWDDTLPSYVYTYKMGQLRVAFLAEQYGERIIQGIIDESPKLSAGVKSSFSGSDDADRDGFKAYVGRLVGETPRAIAERFANWMRRRYYPEYLHTLQEPPAIPPVELEGEPDAFSTAEDGNTILYRTVERESGRSHLYLADRRDKSSAVQVAVDGVPGIESLYPVLRRVTTLRANELVFFARTASADALFVVPFTKVEKKDHHFTINLGKRRQYDLSHADLIEAGDPAFSPSGDRVAFFALDAEGTVDIYVMKLQSGEITRLTHDGFAERDLTWSSDAPSIYGIEGGGNDGTIIYSSDETEHRRFNLFALDPSTGKEARLTNEPADQRGSQALGNGEVVYSSDARGKLDLHIYDAKTKHIKRITDFVTGLSAPAIGPKGLMAVGVYGGQYQIFDIPTASFLSLDERDALTGALIGPTPLRKEPIPEDAPHYEPFGAGSWRLETGVASVGSYSFGQGALLFGDMLSDRNLLVQFSVYGSVSLTDALVFYLDKSHRYELGVSAFHTFTERRDLNAPGFNPPGTSGIDVFYLQREYGLTQLWSYPFSSFSRVEARLVEQGVMRSFLFPIDSSNFFLNEISTADLHQWNSLRAGGDFEAIASIRFGYDTTRFQFPAGPTGGGSLLWEIGAGSLPFHKPSPQGYGYSFLDAEYHQRVWVLGVLNLRLATGASGGSVFGRQFWLSSFDNLENYQAFDRRLIGTSYFVTNADFEVPLDSFVRIALFTNLKGVLGLDFGSVAQQISDLWPTRTLAGVLGVNLGLGPFELRLHFAKPINTGNNNNDMAYGWVTNISLRYVYF